MATFVSPEAEAPTGARAVVNAAVIVAALGYFVDIYDLILVSIVRKPSLTALGVAPELLLTEGFSILNWQMVGMLIGGILFGVVGDKLGRLQILFGSITLYSLATLANGFVQDLATYKLLRFAAGLGLAGELGAGVTLVSEILPARLRGYGTMIVASVGVSGAVAGNLVAKWLDWRWAYLVGGGLGLVLLVLRIKVRESGMFRRAAKAKGVSRGNFLSLFTDGERLTRYLASILIAVPIWFANAILVLGAPEFAQALGVTGPVSAGDAVAFFYGGLVAGDLASGTLSQVLRSRRKVVLLFLSLLAGAIAAYFLAGRGASPARFLVLCGLLGVTSGYWAIFVTVAAEQFGTNIRATVATTVPNFVRGLVVVVTSSFVFLRPSLGLLGGALAVGAVWFTLALVSALRLRETFGVDLDYLERD
ncbi:MULTISPECIES: MFS transporter [Anaeromyxobacter]|uniref:MFS transporter n=1 Tax=Anaeromyxobacter TaxID=161492 RepID=UPI001F58C5A0|nr:MULTISPECIES: MFS transporter [unclassified Anaeromyxobacter]